MIVRLKYGTSKKDAVSSFNIYLFFILFFVTNEILIDIRTIFTFSSCNDICLMDPDGQTLISGHLDNNIRLWDARTGVRIKELTGVHNGQITSVSMSPGK